MEVKVPDIGDFKDVPVISILVAVGDEVAEEQPLIELESDKATMEVPSPAAGRIGDHLSCEQCLLDIARDMGGQVAVIGKVNKISTLILSMDIVVRDLADGKVIARGTADIRGDNDRAWLRGMQWLVEHRIAPQGAAGEERAPR